MVTVCEMCVAVENKKALEELAKQIEITERKERTIKWCETVLSDYFDRRLKENPSLYELDTFNLYNPHLGIYCNKDNNSQLLCFVTFSKEYYKGETDFGNALYHRDTTITKEKYDFDIIKKYCATFGWDVLLESRKVTTRRSSATPQLDINLCFSFRFKPMECNLR